MNQYELNLEKYGALARQTAAEGCVLLRNEGEALPLKSGERVAVYGRSGFNYYKSGLGSGGLVNTRYVIGILDALKSCKDLALDEKLLGYYEEWLKENPYDEGTGWGKVPWSQKEMRVTEEMLDCGREADASLIIIGRTAGEDQDNFDAPGSYRLSETEEELIEKVCRVSRRTVVILNVGNIIDMSWVEKYQPQAVLYAWQGGQEGGNSVVDVLTGRVNPCGKLTDTIARTIEDYPSHRNFGDKLKNYYQEDIYVGYRYFETFAKDRVLYPFGFGLSYTSFSIEGRLAEHEGDSIKVEAAVTNTGALAGKEVVQVYIKVPQGKLGNPARKLVGFGKTAVLEPGASEKLEFTIPKYDASSYDDSGVTGYKSCYVLEEGRYEIYVGGDVRNAALAGSYEEAFTVLEELQEACAPVEHFQRIRAAEQSGGDGCARAAAAGWPEVSGEENGICRIALEEAPVRTADPRARIVENRPADLPYTGDRGYKLVDVLDEKVSLDDFVSQISDEELMNLYYGEGMCSPRVTPGTAGAFGGVSEGLLALGIPAACCADGPSGIRMDCGTKAFAMPNGTAIGCSFNVPLVEELYEMEGRELRLNKIDSLLGPGMNIHRHPLNGRNFEYISEDPYLTGKISAAQLRGMDRSGIGGTIKHYCGNNQESARTRIDSVVSERALREIYLKGFEIAVKEGAARSVMTTYGGVNGVWTSGNYDLNTTILRKEWGFEGLVMTDWWAEANYEGEKSALSVKAPMIAAQNDLFMVCPDAAAEREKGDLPRKLAEGFITRGELQRGAKNILGFILKSPSILRLAGRISPEELEAMKAIKDDETFSSEMVYYRANMEDEIVIDGSKLNPGAQKSDVFGIRVRNYGIYSITLTIKSDLGPLAQLPVSIYYDNALKAQISIQGTEGKLVEEKRELSEISGPNHFVKLYYGANGLDIEKVVIRLEIPAEPK